MSDRRVIRQALISVSDKTGVVAFARALQASGVHLLSTGGTAKLLQGEGIPVTEVSAHTGFPEMLDGRVKTLHPKIHGGLLARRDLPAHQQAIAQADITPIDLLVVNLYPFAQTIAQADCSFEQAIEQIDIGGPAMIRGAAKNHGDVAVVVDVEDYTLIIHELENNKGATTLATRKALAAKAYARTSAYDAAISNWFASELHQTTPEWRGFGGKKIEVMRYGENPHQSAAFYRDLHPAPGTLQKLGVGDERAVADGKPAGAAAEVEVRDAPTFDRAGSLEDDAVAAHRSQAAHGLALDVQRAGEPCVERERLGVEGFEASDHFVAVVEADEELPGGVLPRRDRTGKCDLVKARGAKVDAVGEFGILPCHASAAARGEESALENVAPSLRAARINAYKTFRTLPFVAATVNQDQLLHLMTSADVTSVALVKHERKLENVQALERAPGLVALAEKSG